MIASWMTGWFSMENDASFAFNTCLTCQRLWDPSLVPAAKPICLLGSYGGQYLLDEFTAGHPVEYTLPEWEPALCGMKLDK